MTADQIGLRSAAVDGFQLAYDVHDGPAGKTVIALHGWPGDRHDFHDVVTALHGKARCIVPDLRGFGDSDRHDVPPSAAYGGTDQARSIVGLIDELGLDGVVLTGYDIGSRIAQVVATMIPERIERMVITPPIPGVGSPVMEPERVFELWYQTFHQLPLIEKLVSGAAATRAYIEHFWSHWSSPSFTPDDAELDRLAASYARPGAFRASLGWYRAAPIAIQRLSGPPSPPARRIVVPTTVLWPTEDPLMPLAGTHHLDDYFETVTLRPLPGVGHFSPVEAPQEFVVATMA